MSQTIPSYHTEQATLVKQLGSMIPTETLDVFNRDAQAMALRYRQPLQAKVGDMAPAFALPNAVNKQVQLEALLQKGPVVITFYRGIWCPYCSLELRILQQILPQIQELGAQLVAISPMTPDHSLTLSEREKLEFEVLSDVGNQVARLYTTVIRQSDVSTQTQAELGIDFFSFYDDKSSELPIPAVFVIAQNGRVHFAASEGGDYRQRTEPTAILNALRELSSLA